jgi:transcriptional repressor NF-X1
LTNDVDEEGGLPSPQSSDSTIVARNSKGKQPERRITETNDVSPQSNGQLRADAPTFEPGNAAASVPPHLRSAGQSKNQSADYVPGTLPRKHAPPTQPSRQPKPQRTRAGPSRHKNRAPNEKPFEKVEPQGMQFPVIKNFKPHTNTFKGPEDIMTRIHKEIGSGKYECMVCYGGLTRQIKVWSCKCCWSVFHLKCIQKWAKQGLQQKPAGPIGADGPPKPSWRCPGCNDMNEETEPSLYTCWCEKTIQPEASKFLPPHR